MKKRKREQRAAASTPFLQWGHTREEVGKTKGCARSARVEARALKGWEGLVTRYTSTFRRFASETPADGTVCVVEIGSSTGQSSRLLFERVGGDRLLCLDTSKELVEQCATSESMPAELRKCFLRCDVLMEPARVLSRCARLIRENKKVNALLISVDIGGNRELGPVLSVIRFLSERVAPLAAGLGCSLSVLVKSESLHMEAVCAASAAALQSPLASKETWRALEKKAGIARDARDGKRAKAATRAHDRRLTRPHKAKLRVNADGVAICRFHNYDQIHGCKRLKSGKCPLDHEHCHICLGFHRAFECTNEDLYLV